VWSPGHRDGILPFGFYALTDLGEKRSDEVPHGRACVGGELQFGGDVFQQALTGVIVGGVVVRARDARRRFGTHGHAAQSEESLAGLWRGRHSPE